MAVTQTCPVPALAVDFDIAARQQLRHTITCDVNVEFALKDHKGAVLLAASGPPSQIRVWPRYPHEVPTEKDVIHPVGMLFGAAGKASWKIELLDGSGTLLRTIKHCEYVNRGGPDSFFDTIRILMT